MELITQVRHFLRDLTYNKTAFFFKSMPQPRALVGSIHGQLICILVVGESKPTPEELSFCSKIGNSGGQTYTIHSMDDLCEIAKSGGWHD